MFVRSLIAATAAVLLAAVGSAQDQLDRRSRDEPEMTYQSGGRVGTCDVVRYTSDGTFLFAAGDDKVVRGWPAAGGGLDTDLRKGETLRWPAWRESRGGIKSIAVSPDGKRIAVGGVGLITSAVAVLERDGPEGRVAALTWPKTKLGGRHFDAVTAVAFDPAGRRVAFGTADGSLWVWTPDKLKAADEDGRTWSAPVLAGRHDMADTKLKQELEAKKDLRRGDFASRLVFFRGEAVVSVCRMGQVLECPITAGLTADPEAAAPAGKELFNALSGMTDKAYFPCRVNRAERTADGNGLVVALSGNQSGNWVLVRALDGAIQARLDLPADHFPRSLAVHPTTGAVAVGVGRLVPRPKGEKETAPRFFAEQDDEIWVYDAPKGKPEPDRTLKHPGRAEAMAFHPTAKDRLAVAGGDADEVTVYDVAAAKPLAAARGAGRKVFGVELTNTGNLLRFRTARDPNATHPNAVAAGDWLGFDLTELGVTDNTGAAANRTWVGAKSDETDGWKVVPDPQDRAVWWVTGGGVKAKLAIDNALFNDPTCYTLVPADAKAGTPTRLLVGHYHGCSLFDLPPAGGPVPKVLAPARIYFGHLNEVLGIAVAAGGKWFVTAGADHTIAAYNLDTTADATALGAKFEPTKEDLLRVTEVTVGSPAWEAGLQVDDRIDLLGVGSNRVFDRRPADQRKVAGVSLPPVGTPADALRALAAPTSGETLTFRLQPRGGGRPWWTLTTLPHRPLWKLYPQFDATGKFAEWVVWAWKGSYYATTTTNGDRLMGWQVNAPTRDGTPRYHPLQAFEKQYRRTKLVQQLVDSRNLADVLKARAADPKGASFAARELPPVDLGLSTNTVAADKPLVVTVEVNPRGTDVDLLPERVELWVNDHRYQTWRGDAKPFRETLKLPPGVFRGGDNQVTVLAFNASGGREERCRVVANPTPDPPPTLLGLAVGVNDYGRHQQVSKGDRSVLGDLKFAAADATAVSSALGEYVGRYKHFTAGGLDRDGSEKGLRTKHLAGLKAKAKPGDVLVLFVAGHGVLIGNKRGGKTEVLAKLDDESQYENVRFVFCNGDFDPRNPAASSVSAAELFDDLAEVNCRKVVLFDVCHSGDVAGVNVIRRFVPNGQGPLVIASCGVAERSNEHPKLGHGLFTAALLEAVGDECLASRDGDGQVTAFELVRYLTDRVRALRRETRGLAVSDQNPICFPPQPPKTVLLNQNPRAGR